MAKIAISSHCLRKLPTFEKRVRNKIQEVAGRFTKLSPQELRDLKGLHLEQYGSSRDKRARTVRITDNYRGIICDTGGETFVLYDVVTHDEADRWMMNKHFQVNPAVGALEVIDVEAVAAATETFQPEPDAAKLYDHRKDKDFTQLGVDEEWIPLLRLVTDEEQLVPLIGMMPDMQAEIILQLTGQETVETIYSDVAGSITPDEIDIEDIEAALDTPAAEEKYHVFTEENEVRDQLARPFSTWRTYLHHSQREIAYRESWNGPVRVTGGAGTGKTIVAVHRAKALADRLPNDGSKRILFTTYTRNLSEAIGEQLRELGGQELLDKVEVATVDSLAARFASSSDGVRLTPADAEVRELLDQLRLEAGVDELKAAFLQSEWEQVILANGCTTRSEYFGVQRKGRGVPLDRRGRAKVWKVIELLTQRLGSEGKATYLQIADQARGHLQRLNNKPYAHVIVDEAQDLHEIQWRLLRACVPEAENDMFIVGDSHQRIYDRRSSLGQCGIRIVGRSFKLKRNYRTTAQILFWALTMLGEDVFDDLNGEEELQDFAGYHSILSGPSPVLTGYKTRGKQLDGAVEQVKSWTADGLQTDEIGIAARTKDTFDMLVGRLREAGVQAEVLERTHPRGEGVKIGTMHRMKGLEFRAVLVIDANDDNLPYPAALTSRNEDAVQHSEDLLREKCLLYVAVTRARDLLALTWSGEPSRYIQDQMGV